jgi:hypothetical protein
MANLNSYLTARNERLNTKTAKRSSKRQDKTLFSSINLRRFFLALDNQTVNHHHDAFPVSHPPLVAACIDCLRMLRLQAANFDYRSAPERTLEHQEEPP